MSYLLDTVALIRHFTGEGKIGATASRILDSVEDTDTILVVSAVSLMEVLYLAEKHRIKIDLGATLRIIGASWCANLAGTDLSGGNLVGANLSCESESCEVTSNKS